MIPPVRRKWSLARLTLFDLLALCADMRPDEIEQYLALTGAAEYDYEVAAAGMWAIPGPRFLLVDETGDRLVAGGFEHVGNGVYRSWMVGTMSAWESRWRSITEGTRFVMDNMIEDTASVIETQALASRTMARKWYERGLGMQCEGVLRSRGAAGQDIVVYSRVRPAEIEALAHVNSEVEYGRRK